jgi:hypothetical protein
MTTNIFSDLEDLKLSGDGIYAKVGGLNVFNSQFNIGHEVYARWVHRGKFGIDGKKKYSKINLIFVGPSYSDLRDQTTHDIAELAKELELFGNASQKELMQHVNGMVFNSSRLKAKVIKKEEKKKDGDEISSDNDEPDDVHEVVEEDLPKKYDLNLNHIPFLTGLKSDTACENLHLIIHDEAHWGIKANSLLEKFFLRVLQILKEFGSIPSPCPTLLVLLVSATSDVLFKPVQEFSTAVGLKNMYAVDWNGLNRTGMSQFVASSYRAVDHLSYINDVTSSCKKKDGSDGLLTEGMWTHRSVSVCQQYKQAAVDFSDLISSVSLPDRFSPLVRVKQLSPAHVALGSLLCCNKSEDKFQSSDLTSGFMAKIG